MEQKHYLEVGLGRSHCRSGTMWRVTSVPTVQTIVLVFSSVLLSQVWGSSSEWGHGDHCSTLCTQVAIICLVFLILYVFRVDYKKILLIIGEQNLCSDLEPCARKWHKLKHIGMHPEFDLALLQVWRTSLSAAGWWKVWDCCSMVSCGIGCAERNHPGVLTRVFEYRGWILVIIGE